MNLIDRYVKEIGKRLPRKNRLDIETEIRSTLEDMLEDRGGQAKGHSDEALTEEILAEYGSPKEVAATYQTHKYLIGPEIFSIYTLVLKIVLAAVTLGLTIASVVSIFGSSLTGPEMLKSLAQFAGELVTALIAVFGNVTLIFAILERVIPASEFEDGEKWTPAELTREPDPNQVKTGETIATIVFTLGWLILLNFYPQVIGIWNFEDGNWLQYVTLSDAFLRYLPWINMSGLLTVALSVYLLRQGIWSALTRWAHVGTQLISIGIMVALISGPDLYTVISTAMDIETGIPFTQIIGQIIPIALLIGILASGIEIVKDVVGMLRPNKVTFPVMRDS